MPVPLRSLLTVCISVFTLSCLPANAQTPRPEGPVWALHGTVVTPTGPVVDAIVLIDGNTIRAVGHGIPIPKDTRVVETHGTIYPGLIDLHNHVTWNVLPRWDAGARFGDRYDWQQVPEYHMALAGPHEKLIVEGHGCAAERYAEVKALVGGATSQAGLSAEDLTMPGSATPVTTPFPQCLGNHIRELGVSSHLYASGTREPLDYAIFPLALDEAHATALRDGLRSHAISAALVHLAEGNNTDAAARREFGFFLARGLLLPGLSIIHGVALTPENFKEMAKTSVGLVWSPHSNIALYGSTTDVAAAKQAGVTLALAPDWSPSGSEGMLQELKYAAVWNATQTPEPFTDRELFQMATQNAATLGGIAAQTGSIVAGKRADLLVLTTTPGDPYGAIVHASASQVALVVVDGVAQYGDPALMQRAHTAGASEPIIVCGTPKELSVSTTEAWSAMQTELTAALNRWGTTLSQLTDCR